MEQSDWLSPGDCPHQAAGTDKTPSCAGETAEIVDKLVYEDYPRGKKTTQILRLIR